MPPIRPTTLTVTSNRDPVILHQMYPKERRLAQTVNEKGTSQIEATRLAQDTTNSKLSASTNIIII